MKQSYINEASVSNPCGKRIQQLCAENNLTRQQLAEKVGLKSQSIYQYTSGIRLPSHTNQDKIARFFGVDVDYLMGRTDVRNVDKLKEVMDGDISALELDIIQGYRDASLNTRKAIAMLLNVEYRKELD